MAEESHVVVQIVSENNQKSCRGKRQNSVLDNFTKLTNGQENIRLKAGVEILKHLNENENAENADSELKYALGRLIRGLGSSNIQTKTGFFVVLVGLFNLRDVSIQDVFECISKELHKGGSNSKSENADICSGQILVVGAILRSHLYSRCEDSDKIKILQLLISAGKQRSYLNLASYKFLINLFDKIDAQEFEELLYPFIKDELCKPWQEHNLDSLYLLMETQKRFPQLVSNNVLRKQLGTSEILCSESLQQLCNTLITIPRLSSLNHPVFELFIEKLSESELTVEFFEQLDGALTKPNRNKYFVATKLITNTMKKLKNPSIIPELLTKNYLQQTINTYKTNVGKFKDKEFQEISQKMFESLVEALKNDNVKEKLKVKVLKKLLFYPGTFIFEKLTKSKLIQNITSCLKSEGVKKLGTIYREVVLAVTDKVLNERISERWWNTDRSYASHLLVKLLNHPSMQEEKEWKVEQLIFLLKLGFFKDQFDNIGHELADSVKETFYSALDLKLTKLDDLRVILSKVVHDFDDSINADNLEVVLRHPISPENYEMWKRMTELASKLERKTKKKNAVFHILFLHLGLQLFHNAKLASDSLNELFSCYERVKKTKHSTAEDTNSEDPLWIEVVVDLFLNLLSHNSHLLRTIINCVFPHLCKYLNASAVHQILSVLDPKNESNPLSKIDEDDSDEEVQSAEENEESADEEQSTESEEDDDDEEEDDETGNEKLRMALQQVLGANVESDAESINLDDLDDEEGDKLDEALGRAFKQFKPNLGRKKKQSKDDETLTHFRIRVLDLIEIYLNTNPPMLLALEIMLPLLQALEFSIRDDHQKPLQDRVKVCLKKLCLLKKFSDWDDVTEDILVDLLKSLLNKGTKNAIIIQDMAEKIADSCIFIVNCSQIVKTTQTNMPNNNINDVIIEALKAFFTRRDCLIPYVLFKNLVQLNWEGLVDLIPLLTDFIFNIDVRPFRRNQAAELLRLFYNNHRFLSSHKEKLKPIQEPTDTFLLNSIQFFKEFTSNPAESKVKEKFFGSLFELLRSIKNSPLEDNSSWVTLGESVRDCRSLVSFSRDTKVAFNKLCKYLNISNNVQMKQNTLKLNNVEDEDCMDGNEKQEKKKKNKNLGKDKLKLKKESKQLRLQSLSEGLGKRHFPWENVDEPKKLKTS